MNLSKIKWFILLNLIFIPFFSTRAAVLPLVQCGTSSNIADKCTLCHLIEGMDRIIDWGMQLLVVCALLGIVAGGIMYIISAGNSGMMESAKGLIKQALWGVVLVLGAWVIVNTTLWLIGSRVQEGGTGVLGITNWYSFKCNAPSGGGGGDGGGGTTPTPTCTYTYSAWTPEPCTAGQTQTRTETKTPSECEGGTRQPTTRECSTSVPLPVDGQIPEACRQFNEAFTASAAGNNNLRCAMVGIAYRESRCNANIVNSSKGACGLMQIVPNRDTPTCDELRSNPTLSISTAASKIRSNQSILNSRYQSTFGTNLGTNYGQSGSSVTYGEFTYDKGNDDLIASYNGGPGDRTNPNGTRQGFTISQDCPTNPPTPAWQCNIDPGGYLETQRYVQEVQATQKRCLGN